MSDMLQVAVISAGSAILATALTIFITPRLQHHFWKNQRRAEFRLAVINEFNKLAAEYLISVSAGSPPGNDFFQSLNAITANIKAWFSEETFRAFKKMEEMIDPNPHADSRLGPQGGQGANDFIQARDTALRAMYKEAGLL